MKISELTFFEGFTSTRGNNDNPQKAFDWDKAAKIIKEHFKEHPDLLVELIVTGKPLKKG
jgi:hypothetical protein